MIRVLFIHQNLPGQFRRLIRYLQTRPDHELTAIGEEAAVRREFLGKVPYAVLRSAQQVASLHVYLTYPFVLSWSMLEAMALGTPVLASDTALVREVIRDGENGYLVPFFDTAALADRAKVLRRYDFESVGLPGYPALIEPLPAHMEAA
jgi:glycosyltransferase involved in cell wall biosynthesis